MHTSFIVISIIYIMMAVAFFNSIIRIQWSVLSTWGILCNLCFEFLIKQFNFFLNNFILNKKLIHIFTASFLSKVTILLQKKYKTVLFMPQVLKINFKIYFASNFEIMRILKKKKKCWSREMKPNILNHQTCRKCIHINWKIFFKFAEMNLVANRTLW